MTNKVTTECEGFSSLPLPAIDVNRCKGCGRCVAACGERLVSLATSGTRKHAVLASSGACVSCGNCIRECLFGAIGRQGEAAPQEPPRSLPWPQGEMPLMLAPMQGLTNRAIRSLFVQWVRPDTVFTEFMRVSSVSAKRLTPSDRREITDTEEGVPLVVQLVGHGAQALVDAALAARAAGARHINLNMGCPYGRMTTGLTGGGMLRRPEELYEVIPALRRAINGTFSIKLRAGYDDPNQVLTLLPLFESAGVDFLVLHPRTVVQEYGGQADHAVTTAVVKRTSLPVIANGDIRTAPDGLRVLRETGAAGLMLGRGAIADPLLFERLRGRAAATPERQERATLLCRYLREVLGRYQEIFCGETQVLGKVKAILATMEDDDLGKILKQLRKAQNVRAFVAVLDGIG
ncbi:tRNA-dihydrouridine synthase [Geobacter argillaceus]|uniref:tRNA-U20a,U20b-dihydrouridine synthase n=1 Tax=Geobacter argillaceus TaxID=345631 RepID=A0A562VII9_9BACT|nr:tRNA-dihydrouridine synthase [Geobacter argillaceus]TWJ17763.1 tRNA-U20a,U20b-dihydrouridine synthase [Geobacter argillaceus]